MTDAEWAVVRDLLPAPSWMEGRGGQPEGYCHRQMVDAVRYLVDNGIKWRAMPADFPVWDRVYAFYRRWRDRGLVKELHDPTSSSSAPRARPSLRSAAARESARGGRPGSGADRRDHRRAVGAGRGERPQVDVGL
ncbi:transposase [Streptomyces sp. NPDC059373]